MASYFIFEIFRKRSVPRHVSFKSQKATEFLKFPIFCILPSRVQIDFEVKSDFFPHFIVAFSSISNERIQLQKRFLRCSMRNHEFYDWLTFHWNVFMFTIPKALETRGSSRTRERFLTEKCDWRHSVQRTKIGIDENATMKWKKVTFYFKVYLSPTRKNVKHMKHQTFCDVVALEWDMSEFCPISRFRNISEGK